MIVAFVFVDTFRFAALLGKSSHLALQVRCDVFSFLPGVYVGTLKG